MEGLFGLPFFPDQAGFGQEADVLEAVDLLDLLLDGDVLLGLEIRERQELKERRGDGPDEGVGFLPAPFEDPHLQLESGSRGPCRLNGIFAGRGRGQSGHGQSRQSQRQIRSEGLFHLTPPFGESSKPRRRRCPSPGAVNERLRGRAAHVDVVDPEPVDGPDGVGLEARPLDLAKEPEPGQGDDGGHGHGGGPAPDGRQPYRLAVGSGRAPAGLARDPPPKGAGTAQPDRDRPGGSWPPRGSGARPGSADTSPCGPG